MKHPTCALPTYNSDRWCPACGARSRHIGSEFDFESGHVGRACNQCRFRWEEAPLFQLDTPPLFRRTQTDKQCPACSDTDKIYSHYMTDLDPDSFDLRSRWILGEDGHAYLNASLGVEVASLVPLLGLRCDFCWPELPLNRPEGPQPTMPRCACAKEGGSR